MPGRSAARNPEFSRVDDIPPEKDSMQLNITVLAGDGIGPEVTEQAVLVLQAVADGFGHQVRLEHKLIGGAALAAKNDPLPGDTLEACLSSAGVLLGEVESPAYKKNPGHLRPEEEFLRI